MKKLLVLATALTMSLSLAACGGKKASETTAAPAPTTTVAAAPATTAADPTKAAEAPTKTAEEAPQADAEELEYTLDYDAIAEWVDSGFIGTDASGSPVVMAIDAANETAIIIFGDNSDMTAASFFGAITYDDTTGTIVDEANGSSLTFGVVEISDDTIELDMGDIGKATIKAATKEEVLETIKAAIENYKHIA